MSTWGAKAEDYATCTCAHQNLTWAEHGIRKFTSGARWQREALLTDEAVERAAWGIHESHDRGDWEHEPAEVLDEYLNMARAALTAAIGGEQ